MQTHLDACFKIKHLASAGRRSNEEELDEQVPARIIMKDAERDRRDAAIASKVTVTNDSSKVCNEFKADCADSGCDAVADRRCRACVPYDDLHLMSLERVDFAQADFISVLSMQKRRVQAGHHCSRDASL